MRVLFAIATRRVSPVHVSRVTFTVIPSISYDDDIVRAIALSLDLATRIHNDDEAPVVNNDDDDYEDQLRAIEASKADMSRGASASLPASSRIWASASASSASLPPPSSSTTYIQYHPDNIRNDSIPLRTCKIREGEGEGKKKDADADDDEELEEDEDEDEDCEGQPRTKRQRVGSGVGVGAGARASGTGNDVWNVELKSTATRGSESRKDGRATFSQTEILGKLFPLYSGLRSRDAILLIVRVIIGDSHQHFLSLTTTFTMSLLKQIGFVRVFYLFIFAYGALLQYNYPFTDLPVSDSLKESFKAQTTSIVRWEGLFGIGFILLIVFALTIILFFRTIILIAMRFRPVFRAKVEEHREVRRARLQALQESGEFPKRSKRAITIDWIVSLSVCVALIINDAIFNRPEETALLESATSRILRNASLMAVAAALEIPFLLLFVFVAAAIKVHRARRGQIHLEGNEELMIGTGAEEQMTQVTTFNHGLEEKLIEFDEGVEKMSEKMQ
ncbi:hypothetical protein D9758_015320 [Tetrapyrgos nigripes]|uniref:Uncharacterized protein n=1 Tax=Tetrapyrgos nigripes TaxID=182062 RepID=A0A8H5CFB4_9AGAR|nr:hypothetical protein D9758_015320 [Tetrapyrgos nigripes]